MRSLERTIGIFGAGGFAKETLCCLMDSIAGTHQSVENVAVFVERDDAMTETQIFGVKVIPQSLFDPEAYDAVVGIGPPHVRKRIVESLPPETRFATIIHPSAVVSNWVQIGAGSIITAGTILTCDIEIGKHAQLNLHSTVGHDCRIGDYFTSAPAVNISGKCNIGDCVYFGTNSSIKEGISVCDDVTIGMGGIVVKDILEAGVYIGNPVRRLDRK